MYKLVFLFRWLPPATTCCNGSKTFLEMPEKRSITKKHPFNTHSLHECECAVFRFQVSYRKHRSFHCRIVLQIRTCTNTNIQHFFLLYHSDYRKVSSCNRRSLIHRIASLCSKTKQKAPYTNLSPEDEMFLKHPWSRSTRRIDGKQWQSPVSCFNKMFSSTWTQAIWMKSLKECDFLECQHEHDLVKL